MRNPRAKGVVRTARLAVFACVLPAIALAACARPTGDYGRAQPSTIHDDVMPAVGARMTNLRRAVATNGDYLAVSKFNLTDDERELRNRSFALVRPPHAADWIAASLVEGQRTGILPPIDTRLDPKSYYAHLRKDSFRSSEARYDRLMGDMAADTELVGPFYELARRVMAVDAERLRVARASADISEEQRRNAESRVEENMARITWVWRALRFRLAAYRIAIDGLEVETPSARIYDANLAWRRLAAAIADAEAGNLDTERLEAAPARPSRLMRRWANDDGKVLIK